VYSASARTASKLRSDIGTAVFGSVLVGPFENGISSDSFTSFWNACCAIQPCVRAGRSRRFKNKKWLKNNELKKHTQKDDVLTYFWRKSRRFGKKMTRSFTCFATLQARIYGP
jgi:hypothetical protein